MRQYGIGPLRESLFLPWRPLTFKAATLILRSSLPVK